jgi:hypothetical protein
MADKDLDASVNPDEPPPTAGSADNARRNPDEWVTEDEPMTEAQATLLRTLCQEAGEPFDRDLSKGHASEWIEALQKRSMGAQPPRILMGDQTDG